MTIEFHHVDAFSARPFGGNPAAVCLPMTDLEPATMQALAAEMNLSETAFIAEAEANAEIEADENTFNLRWFTPAAEVELCGHATLASAHVLWQTARADRARPIVFHTRFAGALVCRRQSDGFIEMALPADPPSPAELPAGLLDRLGLEPEANQPSQVNRVVGGKYDLVLELADEASVRQLMADFAGLGEYDFRGIAVTAQAEETSPVDVVSRFFAPRLRIDEDPVTGSLHCLLGPYWSRQLGKRRLLFEQASPRSGRVRVEMPEVTEDTGTLVYNNLSTANGEWPGHVCIAGQAVTLVKGMLTL